MTGALRCPVPMSGAAVASIHGCSKKKGNLTYICVLGDQEHQKVAAQRVLSGLLLLCTSVCSIAFSCVPNPQPFIVFIHSEGTISGNQRSMKEKKETQPTVIEKKKDTKKKKHRKQTKRKMRKVVVCICIYKEVGVKKGSLARPLHIP